VLDAGIIVISFKEINRKKLPTKKIKKNAPVFPKLVREKGMREKSLCEDNGQGHRSPVVTLEKENDHARHFNQYRGQYRTALFE